MSDCLLPRNSTPLERALSNTRSENTNLKTDINILIDPHKAPVQFLPFLAWALSVDYWEHDWPEQVKRDMVAKSRSLHEIKGSVPALRKMLAIFGYTADFKYWYQQNPPAVAGTFEMTVNLNNHGLDERREKEVTRLIDETKTKSRHISKLSFALASTGKVFIGGALFVGEDTIIYPYSPKQLTSSGSLKIAATLHIIETTTLKTGASNGL